MARSFSVSVMAAAPPAVVFDLLVHGADWRTWGGRFAQGSTMEGEPGVGAVRILGRPPVVTRERIVEHEAPKRHAYVIDSGLPVKAYRGEVDLSPTPGGGTRIDWRGTLEPRFRGTGRALAAMSRLVVTSLAKRLAAEAERRARA